jgi:hypothetical protein
MSGSIMVTRSVSSSRKPRYALATGKQVRYDFPITVRDKSGRVRVVSGEVVRPKRGRKGRASKNRKVAYRLSAQRVKGSGSTFDSEVMARIGTIHQEH